MGEERRLISEMRAPFALSPARLILWVPRSVIDVLFCSPELSLRVCVS